MKGKQTQNTDYLFFNKGRDGKTRRTVWREFQVHQASFAVVIVSFHDSIAMGKSLCSREGQNFSS
ncbi:hypothetical protein GDO86_013763 [Hymenochirus boettgeri]|uniref:Uncharacterized protein n=1 Tax=Hymenochirus boettgeri TaxID=247094 RepID=A0A8T2JLF1_9PIPI|nr:hypothetical protein GDO86_013763 [Hymenochirus boettgeri]KAG8446010.1 hypothetical protein GDO86_013763 [Hymenochirus boettgeri]